MDDGHGKLTFGHGATPTPESANDVRHCQEFTELHVILALAQAEERKSRTYPEFGQQGRCKLVVLALEVGGRWSTATQTFLRALARGRALASPSHSRAALAHALQRRWGQMLTVAANTAFSSSLLELPATAVPSAGALPPPLAEVVADARWT